MSLDSLSDHEAVTRFENVKGQFGAGKEDHFEWEQRQQLVGGHATLCLHRAVVITSDSEKRINEPMNRDAG